MYKGGYTIIDFSDYNVGFRTVGTSQTYPGLYSKLSYAIKHGKRIVFQNILAPSVPPFGVGYARTTVEVLACFDTNGITVEVAGTEAPSLYVSGLWGAPPDTTVCVACVEQRSILVSDSDTMTTNAVPEPGVGWPRYEETLCIRTESGVTLSSTPIQFGANAMTIANGHANKISRFVAGLMGDFKTIIGYKYNDAVEVADQYVSFYVVNAVNTDGTLQIYELKITGDNKITYALLSA